MKPSPAAPFVLIRTEVRIPLAGAPLSGPPPGAITLTTDWFKVDAAGCWLMSAPKTVAALAQPADSANAVAAIRTSPPRRAIWGTVIAAPDRVNRWYWEIRLARLTDESLDARLLDRLLQPVLERDLRLPAEQVLGAGDVGLADLRVVDGQRLVDDLRARAGHLDHGLGELEQRVLVLVADVDRQVDVGLAQGDQPADLIVHVTEAPRLAAVAEDGERLVLERLAQEGRDGTAVVGAHPRPVGVEGPRDAGVDSLLAVVGHRHRLGIALCLVVDAARADRVDVAPVVLGLGMDLRVAVDLGGRCDEDPGPLELRHAEHVVGPVGADLERVERQPRVVDRAGRRCEVVDEVDGLLDIDRLDDVLVREDEVLVADVVDVLERPGVQVVDADHPVSLAEQVLAQVRSEKSSSSGDDGGGGRGHRRARITAAACAGARWIATPDGSWLRGGRGRDLDHSARRCQPLTFGRPRLWVRDHP